MKGGPTGDRYAGSPPALRVEELSLSYPGFRLGPLTLSLGAGERVALLGANGAGKSTTLRVLAGRSREYGGRVRWWGRELRTLLPGIRGRFGVVPEGLLGFGWTTVDEHLRFLSEFHPGWDRAYEDELIERMELPRERRLSALSKGTKVKLSFVAAEAYRPPVLLLDEPTSGVDPVMRGQLLDLLDRCVPAGGRRTLIFSSHILEDVTRICDRILVLEDGRLVEDASRRELRERARAGSLSGFLEARLARRG